MTCVTYGVARFSYHSTRALQESGKTNGPNPNTLNVILNDVWVDDLLSGADTLEETCVIQDDLFETLNKNCLPLRKWSSNEPQLVTRLLKDLQEAGEAYEINDKTRQFKTLGLTWHPLCTNVVASMFQPLPNELYSVMFQSILIQLAL